MRSYPLIAFAMLLTFSVKGQQLLFNNISHQLGLPAQETYNVMQDSKGYIWVSTEAGLCKYNGSYSKLFNKKNGLPENSCYAVKEDPKGGLWMLTSSNRVLQYLNDSLKEAPFSKSFSEYFKSTLPQIYSIYFVNDSALISAQHQTFIANIKSKKIEKLKGDTACGYYFVRQKDVLIEIKNEINADILNKAGNKDFVTIGLNTGKEVRYINLTYTSKDQPTWRVLTASNKKGEDFIAFGGMLIKLKKDLDFEVFEFQNEIVSLYSDNEDGLWVGALKSGVHYYSNTASMKDKLINLEGFSVTGIHVDKEKGVWCTTLEKGVFYCRNKNIITYSNNFGLEKPADLLKFEEKSVFVSSGNNELIELAGMKMIRHELSLINKKPISDLSRYGNGWLITGKNFILKTDDKFRNGSYLKSEVSDFHVGASQIALVSKNKLYGIHFGQIFTMTDGNYETIKTPLESGGRCLQYLESSKILYGCKDGLYLMDVGNVQQGRGYLTKKMKGITGAVTKIIKSTAGEIWAATKETGLYLINGDSTFNLTSSLKLPTDRYYDIAEDKYGSIWVGSNIGLFRINHPASPHYKNMEFDKFDVKIYNTLNGLPSDEVYKVASDSSYIYFSTTEGIGRFSLNAELVNVVAPTIYLSSLRINGQEFPNSNNLKLAYNDNSFKIEFDVLTFKEINEPRLRYCLSGAFNKEIYKEEIVKGNVISFDNIPPGSYELTVYAVNNDGVKSIQPLLINFEVQKPFWQKGIFILGCIVFIGLLIIAIIRLNIDRIRKKEEEKTSINKQLAEFQLTALQAQMNPHFIFNAINSIQNYVLQKKEQEAYNYLAKFSKLIRMVLNNSEHKTLSIREELEAVKLYVELEQLRFKKSFEFTLTVGSDIDEDRVQVPTMLIQPYIENAIWHGLMNLEDQRTGKLSLVIGLSGESLKVSIEDNGIGRERAGAYKKESIHKPVAMKLTEKRLYIINTMQDYEGARVEVKDLKNGHGEADGTRVDIYLPIM